MTSTTGRPTRRVSLGLAALCAGLLLPAFGQPFRFPTANQALFEPGGEPDFFVGTSGKSWTTGTFGCVRSGGHQMHEGLDIRCLQRDRHGEPTDPVLAAADGTVAYVSTRASLSNYGKYIVLRHEVDSVEIYSLYGHLSRIREDIKPGRRVKAGENLGVMGRTANTREGISKDRAHVHFELDLIATEHFSNWWKERFRNERNDHGEWNGLNLLGIDPRQVLLQQKEQGSRFSLLQFVQNQTELCRVLVHQRDFPWVKRYAPLIRQTYATDKEDIAGYEMALNFNGIPFELIPRGRSDFSGKSKFKLLSVNEQEALKNPCRGLLMKRTGRWQLTTRAMDLLGMLTY